MNPLIFIFQRLKTATKKINFLHSFQLMRKLIFIFAITELYPFPVRLMLSCQTSKEVWYKAIGFFFFLSSIVFITEGTNIHLWSMILL